VRLECKANYAARVKKKMSAGPLGRKCLNLILFDYLPVLANNSPLMLDSFSVWGYNYHYATGGMNRYNIQNAGGAMAGKNDRDVKAQALERQGVLNRKAEHVEDALFREEEFFDARDLVQVKYEMVRRVRAEGEPISKTARAFGVSRVSFYQAQQALEREGLAGLVPKKRGPRGKHKMTADVMRFLVEERGKDPSIRKEDLCVMVKDRFGLSVHPRTIERALQQQKKGAARKATGNRSEDQI
jgi:transposase